MIRRFLLVSACAAVLTVLVAAPAGAHAQLQETNPRSQAELEASPDAITLTFDEPVEVSIGGIRLYDGAGDRIDVGAPEAPDGDDSRVRSTVGELAEGSYVVTWRVSSTDGHPIQGAFTFQVGDDATANIETLAARLLADQSGNRALGIVYGIDRFLVFASIALLLGGIGFVAVIAPSTRASTAARRLLIGAVLVCASATLASIGLHGAYIAGLGLGDALDPSLAGDVLDLRFGQVAIARVVFLVALGALLIPLVGRRSVKPLPAWWYVATGLFATAVAVTPALAGHASSGEHILAAQVTDTVHVLAMSAWLGGLVLLCVAFLPGTDAGDAERPLTRFSRVALTCVALLVITGVFQSWRQVGSIAGLRDTDYGKLLVLKVVLVGVLVIVAVVSREIVYRLYGPLPDDNEDPEEETVEPVVSGAAVDLSDDPRAAEPRDVLVDESRELQRLRWTVTIEILLAVAVLAVTAALVNTPPARGSIDGPFADTIVVTDDLRWQFVVDPAAAGPNDIHITATTPGGGPADPLEVTVTARYPAEDIGPLEIPLRQSGPGHYIVQGFDLPIAGEWVFEIKTLVTTTQEETNEVSVQLR